jgi:hypothetical protein
MPRVPWRKQVLRAMAQFARGLVGEGDGEDAVRRHAHHFGEPCDAMHEYARLAAAGAGEDQVVPGGRGHGLALGRIQRVEQVGDIHAAHSTCGMAVA